MPDFNRGRAMLCPETNRTRALTLKQSRFLGFSIDQSVFRAAHRVRRGLDRVSTVEGEDMTHEECESAEALALQLTEHEQVMSKQRDVIDELASKLKALADMVNENTERL